MGKGKKKPKQKTSPPPQPNMQTRPSFTERVRDLLGWFKGVGIATGILGGVCLMQEPSFFPFSVGCVYVAIGLLALDLFFEPFFARWKRIWQIGAVAFFVAILFEFSMKIVFVKNPLSITAQMTDAEYPNGTRIAGLDWKPEFTEVQVWVNNQSATAYEDMDLVIRPSSAVAEIAQQTSVPDVSFEDKNGQDTHLLDLDLGTQKKSAIPVVLLATDAGYRIRCPHLPARTAIEIVIALADIRWDPPPPPLDDIRTNKNSILRIKYDDFSTYWYGYADSHVYATRPTSDEWMMVEGHYVGSQRIRTISSKILVGGKIHINPKQPG
jgi:hypothetical protein